MPATPITFPHAGSAIPAAPRTGVSVLLIERMAVDAPNHPSMLSSKADPTQNVLSVRYRF